MSTLVRQPKAIIMIISHLKKFFCSGALAVLRFFFFFFSSIRYSLSYLPLCLVNLLSDALLLLFYFMSAYHFLYSFIFSYLVPSLLSFYSFSSRPVSIYSNLSLLNLLSFLFFFSSPFFYFFIRLFLFCFFFFLLSPYHFSLSELCLHLSFPMFPFFNPLRLRTYRSTVNFGHLLSELLFSARNTAHSS